MRSSALKIALFLLLQAALAVYAQTRSDSASKAMPPAPRPDAVSADFTTGEIMLVQGEIVSNVLRVTNTTPRTAKFRVSMDYPAGWKTLFRSDRFYEVEPGDSLFLPVRMLPTAQILGNTRFMVSAYLITEDDIQLANTFFWSFTEKKTSWVLNIEPSSKNYFKNGSNQTTFKVNVLNTGTESQPISLSLNNTSLYSILSDSTGLPLKNPTYTLNLQPFQDTTFAFTFKYFQGERNFSRIDIENHKPENMNEERTFSVFVNTVEPNLGGGNGFQSGQKVNFTRLSSDKKVNPYGTTTMPMVVDLNVSNILNDITFTTLNVRGMTQLSQDEMLMYNFQTTTSTNYYEKPFANSMYYLGYYYNKGSIQGGFINGGMMGIQSFGRGLKSDYYVTRNQRIGAFYVNNTGLAGSSNAYAFGANYQVKYYKQNSVTLEYGRSENSYAKTVTDAYNARTTMVLYKGQMLNLNFSNTMTRYTDLGLGKSNVSGYFGSFTYNGNFFKNKLNTNHGAGRSTSGYSNSNIDRFYYNQSTRYNLNPRLSFILVNGYNRIRYTIGNSINNYTQNNQVSLNVSRKNTSFQQQLFYNIYSYPVFSYHSRGLGFSYNVFMPQQGTRVSTNIQLGYNKPFNTTGENDDRFFAQWGGFVTYRTLTFNARYNMSPTSPSGLQTSAISKKTPQNFSASIQHQYLFSNTHFMLQTGFNYYYNNVFNQHSASLFPELYYFTNDGWRFKVNFNYNLVSGNVYNFSNQQPTDENTGTYVNQNTFIGFGVRKEFGVPVPFVKKKNFDVDFVAFYDLNGNGQKDRNEQPIENVVIILGDHEVITNEEGEAHMQNFPKGLTSIFARNLDANESWFANIPDSLMIIKDRSVMVPFVRGVKIKGKVGIDRESIRVDANSPFDLSRIKITASGSKPFDALTDFEGNFEFYLPYGKYVITMDEKVLGDKFKLARNNYEVEVNKNVDGMMLSYLIVEKRRKINKKTFTSPGTK